MTRIVIMSDTHGFSEKAQFILMKAEAEGKIDAIIHCGDGFDDLQDLNVPLPPVYQCAGNCDFFNRSDVTYAFFGDKRIVITHGHRQHCKESLDALYAFGKCEKADIVCFGHTHHKHCEEHDGTLYINPGAGMYGGYAVMTIDNNGRIQVKQYS